MKLSLITPVYDDPRVERALASAHDQRLPDDVELERIVVDGGSGDPTASILEDWREEIDVLVSEPDEGIYDAMNKGVDAASGDVVGILNADDRYQDERVLADVVNRFREQDVDACYGDLVYVDEDDDVVRYWESGEHAPERWRRGWMPPHPTFFVHREVYEEHGVFDLDYPIAADYELMLRLLLVHEVRVGYIDRVLVRMATGGNANASASAVLDANLEVRRAWQKHGLDGGGLVPVLKPLRKAVQFVRRP